MARNVNLRVTLLIIAVLTMGFHLTNGDKKNNVLKIVGGTQANISDMNYLVYLRRDGQFACGGALIDPLYAVTAAHCVQGFTPSALTVTGGTSYLNVDGVTRGVSKIHMPPNYSRITMNNDVAVLQLDSPLEGVNIGTIPLCSRKMRPGALLRVSGWGITNEGATLPSSHLLTTTIRLRSGAVCRRVFRAYIYTRSMMCASALNTDSCAGDSGGPAVYQRELCGIVSWGNGCARSGFPGVYTVINRVRNFIQRAVKS